MADGMTNRVVRAVRSEQIASDYRSVAPPL